MNFSKVWEFCNMYFSVYVTNTVLVVRKLFNYQNNFTLEMS